MQQTIKRTELKEALEIVKPGLASKEIIEQSTSFAFMGDKVVTYNDKISMSHPVKGLDITGAVKADEMYQLLSKLKADEMSLEVQDNEIIIKAGKSTAGLMLAGEITLPLDQIDEIDKMLPIPDGFLEGIRLAVQSCARDMSREVLTCIEVKGDKLNSSDNMRLSVVKLAKAMPVDTFLLPADVVPLVLQMKASQIALTEGWVHFGNAAGTMLSARIFADSFPDVSKLLQIIYTVEITLPEGLLEMMDRATVFSKRDHYLDERVVIQIEPKKIRIKGESETGWYKEVAKCAYDGDVITFDMVPFLFKDILGKVNTCKYSKEQGVLKFESKEWQYIAKVL
jgi:DNA polymerase III sliding clamp (beta) subunit (PCNA family)